MKVLRFALAGLLALPSLMATAVQPAPAQATAPAAEAALPPAKELMERYLAAIGGTERLKQVKSRQVALKLEMPAAKISGIVKIYQVPPAMALAETEIGPIGKVMQGSDGETVWESSMLTGTRIITGAERAAFLRGMRFNADYDYQELFKSMETKAIEKFGDKRAYVVELVTNDDAKETRFFDVESGLLIGLRSSTPTSMGEIQSETAFTDYREVGGIKMPFKSTVKALQNEMVTTVEKAEIDIPIPAEKFFLPDDVKALLAKQSQPGAPVTETPGTTPVSPTPAPAEKK